MLPIAIPGEDKNGDVMIPMQEDQILFAQHNEQSVTKFRDFGQSEHPSPETGDHTLFDIARTANGMVKTKVMQHVNHFRPETNRTDNGKGG